MAVAQVSPGWEGFDLEKTTEGLQQTSPSKEVPKAVVFEKHRSLEDLEGFAG